MNQVATELRSPQQDQDANPAPLEKPDRQLMSTAAWSATSLRSRARALAQKNSEWLIRKILVPTDYSQASTKAIQRAVAIANQCNAKITVLHVIDVNAQGAAETAEDLMKRVWNDGSAQMAQLAYSLAGQVGAQTMLAEGLPAEVIIEKSSEFDLVVVAKSRRKRGWKLFSKHTARRVIENAICPVMVVQELA